MHAILAAQAGRAERLSAADDVIVNTATPAGLRAEVSVLHDLAERGFRLHSLSDVVREEAAARNLPPLREHLIRIGNEMRAKGGPGVLAARLLARIGARDVVDSIRNPAEVAVLRAVPGFVLIGVRAVPEVRFRRSLHRARPGDLVDARGVPVAGDPGESGRPHGPAARRTFALADRVLDNDGAIGDLRREVDRVLADLEQASTPAR